MPAKRSTNANDMGVAYPSGVPGFGAWLAIGAELNHPGLDDCSCTPCVSERWAYGIVGLNRSTERLTSPPIAAKRVELRQFLRSFVTTNTTVNPPKPHNTLTIHRVHLNGKAPLIIDVGADVRDEVIGSFTHRRTSPSSRHWYFSLRQQPDPPP